MQLQKTKANKKCKLIVGSLWGRSHCGLSHSSETWCLSQLWGRSEFITFSSSYRTMVYLSITEQLTVNRKDESDTTVVQHSELGSKRVLTLLADEIVVEGFVYVNSLSHQFTVQGSFASSCLLRLDTSENKRIIQPYIYIFSALKTHLKALWKIMWTIKSRCLLYSAMASSSLSLSQTHHTDPQTITDTNKTRQTTDPSHKPTNNHRQTTRLHDT